MRWKGLVNDKDSLRGGRAKHYSGGVEIRRRSSEAGAAMKRQQCFHLKMLRILSEATVCKAILFFLAGTAVNL